MAPQYNFVTQARIIHAICVLHNFIICHDPTDATVYDNAELSRVSGSLSNHGANAGQEADVHVNQGLEEERDNIAKDMWEQYKKSCS